MNTYKEPINYGILNFKFWLYPNGLISRVQFLLIFPLLFLIFYIFVLLIDISSNKLIDSYYMDLCYIGLYYIESRHMESCFLSVFFTNLALKIPLILIYLYVSIVLIFNRFRDAGKHSICILWLIIPVVSFYYLWVLFSHKSVNNVEDYQPF